MNRWAPQIVLYSLSWLHTVKDKHSLIQLLCVCVFVVQVDMPVFFYIDPEFSEDPAMARVTNITLSYTFFEAKEGESIYLPLSPSHHRQ